MQCDNICGTKFREQQADSCLMHGIAAAHLADACILRQQHGGVVRSAVRMARNLVQA